MKVTMRAVLMLLLILFLQNSSASAISVSPPPAQPAKIESPILITGYSTAGWRVNYIQLFNASSEVVDISGWKLYFTVASQPGEVELPVLDGMLKPGGYTVVADATVIPAADFSYELSGTMTGNVTAIRLAPPSTYQDHAVVVKGEAATTHWKRNISASTGNYLSTFTLFQPTANFTLYGNGLYEPPESTALQFTEILANPRSCSPVETAGECADFVKVYNPTAAPIDLSQFRLRVGFQGQNATSSNTFQLSGVVQSGQYKAITKSADNRSISLTSSGAFVWLEDMYGVEIYESTLIEYPDASSESKKGHAWAYDAADGIWKWTSQPIATGIQSVFPPPLQVAKVSASVAPCKEGQYRSEETNRCRALSATTTALAPCDDDEERNPNTNRCRKIASLANAELAPCKEGQERNPETNRCRNVISPPSDVAFKPEPVADTGKAFVGWWALGGVGTLALGYGAWEWRREVAGLVQKFGSFFTSGK